MATAAAHLQATREVSPELVLVDDALARELRESLATPPVPPEVAAQVVLLPPADLEPDETVDTEVAESSGGIDASDLIVGLAGKAAREPEAVSGYPSLPAPDDAEVDSMEATEAALRGIRARLSAQRRPA